MNRRQNTSSNIIQVTFDEKSRFTFARIAICLLMIFIVGGLTYFLFLSKTFTTISITTNGEHYVDKSQVNSYLSKAIGKNIFLYQLDMTDFLKKFPIIESIQVQKNYPKKINFQIKELTPYVLLQTDKATYVYSQHGIQLDVLANSSTKYTLPLVLTSEQTLKQINYTQLNTFIGKLEKDKNGFISDYQFESPSTLIVFYQDGHKVTFSLEKSLTAQMSEVNTIRSKVGFINCYALDVRFSSIYCIKK